VLTPLPPPASRVPTRCPLAASRGFTLAELVVALSLGGVAIGAFALVVARQERVHAELARRVRAQTQLREGVTALVADLHAVSPAAGDILPGGARDSSIEFRATIGTAVSCEVRDRTVLVALASFVTSPKGGDTAWVYTKSSPEPVWAPLALEGLAATQPEVPPGCPFPPEAGSIIGRAVSRRWYSLVLAVAPTAALPAGTPIRITRPVRYSLYRAPDGQWYLGRREWSTALGRFETVQPVSGPYRVYAPPGQQLSGFELQYRDTGRVEIPSGSAATDRIAEVTVAARAPPRPLETWARRGVTSVTVGLRNRK
jgi:prepilin-type N-terminal cleavage/methylation domain-containing protein